MHCTDNLPELPAAPWHAAATEPRTPHWELDAALAVLERAREEWATLPHSDAREANQQMREVLRRRLLSAQQLVARIQSKLRAASDPSAY